MIIKSITTKSFLAIGAAALILSGCQKERTFGDGNYVPQPSKTVTLDADQQRKLQDMVTRVPKLAYFDAENNRFIQMDLQNRDWTFVDAGDGWTFDDPDGNGVDYVSTGDGGIIVFSGVYGNNTGGGMVVAGSSALDIDIAFCLSAEEVGGDDGGLFNIFDSGFGYDEFALVFGIAGDFEALANADTESEDFDPFEYFEGFAEYFVLSDDISGSHEVFDWMDEEEDVDDMAAAFLMDFQNLALYFSVDGTVNVSGGQMQFDGEYLALYDLFLDYLEEGEDDPEFDVVPGFGAMGCGM
ncbi:MAG: hypothetical protein RL220_1450 [Bacteroidota bacterium]